MCHMFVVQEDTPDNERTLAARENTYVRMYGHIRGFGGKTSVVAFRVVPLVDMNELTMHLLEVMHSHMVLTKAQSVSTICHCFLKSSTFGICVVGHIFLCCPPPAWRHSVGEPFHPKKAIPNFLFSEEIILQLAMSRYCIGITTV